MLSEVQFQSLKKELDSAFLFEKKGELNRSRVVARQVAGKAIRIFVAQLGLFSSSSLTPYQYLVEIQGFHDIIFPIQSDLEALTTRVNIDFSFPEELNLLKSANNIINFVKNYER